MVYTPTNKLDQTSKNKNIGITCTVEHKSTAPNKVTKSKSLQKPPSKDLDKKIASKDENYKHSKTSEFYLKPNRMTRKRKLLEEESSLHCKKKLSPKRLSNSEIQVSKEIKQKKLKKKQKTHIIIWERKLTGAQRVSKRLSNLRTKNKISEKVKTLNLFPVALIEKYPVKVKSQKKRKRSINNNKNEKKENKILLIHRDQYGSCDSHIQNNLHKSQKRKNHETNFNLEINLQNEFVQNPKTDNFVTCDGFIQTKAKSNTRLKETKSDTVPINSGQLLTESETKAKSNSNTRLKETKSDTVPINSGQLLTESEHFSNDEQDIKTIEKTELIHLRKEEKVNDSDIIGVLEEECLDDSDIIIVELEPAEHILNEGIKEEAICTDPCDKSAIVLVHKCDSVLKEKENSKNFSQKSDNVHSNDNVSTDFNEEDKSKINKEEACGENVSSTETCTSENVVNMEIIPDEVSIQQAQ